MSRSLPSASTASPEPSPSVDDFDSDFQIGLVERSRAYINGEVSGASARVQASSSSSSVPAPSDSDSKSPLPLQAQEWNLAEPLDISHSDQQLPSQSHSAVVEDSAPLSPGAASSDSRRFQFHSALGNSRQRLSLGEASEVADDELLPALRMLYQLRDEDGKQRITPTDYFALVAWTIQATCGSQGAAEVVKNATLEQEWMYWYAYLRSSRELRRLVQVDSEWPDKISRHFGHESWQRGEGEGALHGMLSACASLLPARSAGFTGALWRADEHDVTPTLREHLAQARCWYYQTDRGLDATIATLVPIFLYPLWMEPLGDLFWLSDGSGLGRNSAAGRLFDSPDAVLVRQFIFHELLGFAITHFARMADELMDDSDAVQARRERMAREWINGLQLVRGPAGVFGPLYSPDQVSSLSSPSAVSERGDEPPRLSAQHEELLPSVRLLYRQQSAAQRWLTPSDYFTHVALFMATACSHSTGEGEVPIVGKWKYCHQLLLDSEELQRLVQVDANWPTKVSRSSGERGHDNELAYRRFLGLVPESLPPNSPGQPSAALRRLEECDITPALRGHLLLGLCWFHQPQPADTASVSTLEPCQLAGYWSRPLADVWWISDGTFMDRDLEVSSMFDSPGVVLARKFRFVELLLTAILYATARFEELFTGEGGERLREERLSRLPS